MGIGVKGAKGAKGAGVVGASVVGSPPHLHAQSPFPSHEARVGNMGQFVPSAGKHPPASSSSPGGGSVTAIGASIGKRSSVQFHVRPSISHRPPRSQAENPEHPNIVLASGTDKSSPQPGGKFVDIQEGPAQESPTEVGVVGQSHPEVVQK